MTKIDIISGFLGAGKTTLIKKLFESSLKKEKVVLIENEFGEIGIDGSFLKESGVEIKEINSGCICCSLVGDFSKSMKQVIDTYHPERIIIEPSGVGKLSDIINAIEKVEEELQINIVCCVVDGKKLKLQLKNFGEFLSNQIQYANNIVVSKTDTISEEKLEETLKLIKEINEKANVITTNISELDSENILKILEEKDSLKDELLEQVKKEHHEHHHHEDEECCCGHHEHHHHEDEECCCGHHEHHHHEDEECCCGHHEHHHHEDEECCCGHHEHHHHHHDADEVFVSWGIETVKSISKEKLSEFLSELEDSHKYGIVLRSKGILKAKDSDSWYYFDYVAGDYSIREGNPDYTGRIVVIGSKVEVNKIEELFNEKAN